MNSNSVFCNPSLQKSLILSRFGDKFEGQELIEVETKKSIVSVDCHPHLDYIACGLENNQLSIIGLN